MTRASTSMRSESQLGWLLLEWLGVLVPGAFRQEVRSWGAIPAGRRAGMSRTMALAMRDTEGQGPGLGPVVWDECGSFDEATLRAAADAMTFAPGEMLTWPNVESMLSGKPPEGYDAALARAAAESGGAIARVDPERGTVTVSSLEDPCADFKKIPGSSLTVCPEWAEAMGYDPDKLEDA